MNERADANQLMQVGPQYCLKAELTLRSINGFYRGLLFLEATLGAVFVTLDFMVWMNFKLSLDLKGPQQWFCMFTPNITPYIFFEHQPFPKACSHILALPNCFQNEMSLLRPPHLHFF